MDPKAEWLIGAACLLTGIVGSLTMLIISL